MRSQTVFAFLGAVMALYLPAAEAEERLRISCPEKWPGPWQQGMPLSYSAAWYDTQHLFGEWETEVAPPYDTTTLIDCAYGKEPPKSWFHGAYYSISRITVAVPGHVRRCEGDRARPHPVSCETTTDPDGTIAPVRLFIAQRVTLATTLLGYALRRDRDAILTAAASGGFSCSDPHGSDDRRALLCTRGDDRLIVRFGPGPSGLSSAIELDGPANQAERQAFWDRTVLRFGLGLVYGTEQDVAAIWQEPGSPARITLRRHDDDSVTLVLSEAPPRTK